MTFDGDPKLYQTGDGADLVIQDGQPVMDEGLENAVTLSLFCVASEWWGNAIADDTGETGSELESLNRRTLTVKTMQDAEAVARDALAWMIDQGIAKTITVTGTMPAVGMLGLTIAIEQPDGNIQTLKYSINWATMAARVGAAA